jgi:hypothetical protein
MRMNDTLGLTITGDVATITLTVPALWVLVLLVLSGVLMTYTTTRNWLASVIERVRSEAVGAQVPRVW